MVLAVLSLSFLLFLILGLPVAFAIGLSCLLAFLVEGLPLATAFQSMVSGMNVFSFLAIPFFIFSGEIMLHGGIAEKIVTFARNLVGHWRGGLGMANVMACTLFGGVSGSPGADVSAMGGVMIPMMKKEGYSADYAVNVTTHAALCGALMPTSHNMIIYAFAAQGAAGVIGDHVIRGVSIGDLMFAGLLPVICLMICMLFAAYWVAVKNGYPRRPDGSTAVDKFPGWGAVVTSFIAALPGLFVVAIILGCIIGGVTTATEAAGIAVCYSLFLTFVAYRTMNWKKLMMASSRAAKTTGIVLLLIGVSNILQWQMAFLELPDLTAQLLLSATDNPLIMFALINIILFLLGTFMDMAATILICTPLFLPLAIQMGMGPVQFGMVLLLNCALGLNTPPVGTVQFIGCAIGGVSVGQVMRTILPFYTALFVAMAVVTYVPAFSTWLPSLITGHPVL
ncbi:TRAP transporter large permease [Uliginosibacterium sp. sgz301328]|uniref:TRAP transporter large permease n=1 Tax=Uliginosibacterium sp. sgz301328 TaxID=3243764 RepID=UPI00359EA299